jgi:glycosyltransferase involved in cell wall biosynthesis
MRILIVCSGNKGQASPFVEEQARHLKQSGCAIELFLIQGKGWKGYLKNRSRLVATITSFKPDIVHAHSGMSALLAGLQRSVPVVATFHGSDVNVARLRFFTRIASVLSRAQIVVSQDMKRILGSSSVHVIPCAVNTDIFFPADRQNERQRLGWATNETYVLFSSSFTSAVKNAPLAMEAVRLLSDYQVHLIELNGKSRQEVASLLNACDVALMTSFSEGSPQFIKEAMACATPVVSTRVGDVAELSEFCTGHFLADFHAHAVAQALRKAIQFRLTEQYTNGPEIIRERGLNPSDVSEQLMRLYASIIRH